jgi:hypothetical protein
MRGTARHSNVAGDTQGTHKGCRFARTFLPRTTYTQGAVPPGALELGPSTIRPNAARSGHDPSLPRKRTLMPARVRHASIFLG